MTWNGWAVTLNGVTFTTCATQDEWDATGCAPTTVIDGLEGPPDGLDLPDLRVNDVQYYQRDGVKHFPRYYEPRFITITGTIGPLDPDACVDGDCTTIRELVQEAIQAWKRQCCDTELVVWPDCYQTDDEDPNRDVNGPFGVVGMPGAFKGRWLNREEKIYEFTARFDAVDQRMYVLDECGTPGYSTCENINPGAQLFSHCFAEPSCFTGAGFCFDTEVVSDDSVAPTEITVGGTEKVFPTITFYPPLVSPTMQNMTTGEFVELDTTLSETDTPVTVNTEDGTAFDADGNSLTHLLRGSLFLSMFPGNYTWRLISNGAQDFADPGYASLCWRDTVVSA